MVAVAIFSADPALRRRLEQLPHEDLNVVVAGAVDSASALLQLTEQRRVDVVLAQAPPGQVLPDWQARHPHAPWIVILDRVDVETSVEALAAGAAAILPRSADPQEIAGAIKAASSGLAVLPRRLVAALIHSDPLADSKVDGAARLTPRELEVLTAMTDGASNKEIARRLDISLHTVKFHVAAILEKLDADTRTEAVMKAAQQGLVML